MKQANWIAFLLIPGFLSAQGAFDGYLKGKGVLDLAPSFSFLRASQFDGNDQLYDLSYRGQLLNVFAEYGLSEKLDVLTTIPYVFTSTQSGLQDGGFYLKYRPIYKTLGPGDRLGFLLGSGISTPLSKYIPTAAGALGQRATTLPVRAIVQFESHLGLFFNITGGYNWRLDKLKEEDIALIRQQRPDYAPENPPNYSTVLAKVGFPAANYYLDAWVEVQRTIGGSNYVPNMPDLPQAYGVDYTQIGGTAYYSESGKNGVLISGAYILKGRNISRVLRITLGAVFKL
jgi:hypothetical protein